MSGVWSGAIYPEAGEASASWRGSSESGSSGGKGPDPDPERSREEAARRARGKIRRYCAANQLNRFWTLTYAGEGQHDPVALRGDIRQFFKAVRRGLGSEAFPYLWVPELHKTGHGYHVHFALGRFVPRSLIVEAWGRGFVFGKLIGNLPVGSGARDEARVAARYLSKYLGKDLDGAGGLNRYDVAQGFQPRQEAIEGRSRAVIVDRASERMGAAPDYEWVSMGTEGWHGPPVVWLQWR